MRKVTKIAGTVVGVGAGVAAVLWMLRDRIARPPKAAEATAPFRVAPPTSAERHDADDLSVIHGIGPVFKGRLAAAGICRFDELAATDTERLAAIAGVAESRAREWVEQARSLV